MEVNQQSLASEVQRLLHSEIVVSLPDSCTVSKQQDNSSQSEMLGDRRLPRTRGDIARKSVHYRSNGLATKAARKTFAQPSSDPDSSGAEKSDCVQDRDCIAGERSSYHLLQATLLLRIHPSKN
jgi:hypothetical protein